MGVYIKNMEMPKTYPLTVTIYPGGQVLSETHGAKDIHGEAVSVPEHGRLGDLDALIEKAIAKYLEHERKDELVFAAAEIKQDIVDLISAAPTIIPAEEGE